MRFLLLALWEKNLGDTADLVEDQGEPGSDWQGVVGVKAWF